MATTEMGYTIDNTRALSSWSK